MQPSLKSPVPGALAGTVAAFAQGTVENMKADPLEAIRAAVASSVRPLSTWWRHRRWSRRWGTDEAWGRSATPTLPW